MASKDWKRILPNEFYNAKNETKINLIPLANGYEVRITNLKTGSSEWTYKTGRTRAQALKIAKNYMKKY